MTEFGKALWMVVTDKGPYSRAGFAKLLGQRTGWEPSRQAMSNWLKGERDAPLELIPATVMALGLDEETEKRLEHLFIYGQRELTLRKQVNGTVPEEPGITAENEMYFDEIRREREEERQNREAEGDRETSNGAKDRSS